MNKFNQGYNQALQEVLMYLSGYFLVTDELTEGDKDRIIKSITSLKIKEAK
jgi:hypothetical protein